MKSKKLSSHSTVTPSIANKYNHLFKPISKLPVAQQNQLEWLAGRYANFYDEAGVYGELSDQAIANFITDDEQINYAHELLTNTLQNPANHWDASIDDFVFTLELSRDTWKRMKSGHKRFKKQVDVSIEHKVGGELGHLYERHWLYKFKAGGEIRFHFMPTEKKQSTNNKTKHSDVIRSSRIALRLSELGHDNLRVFLAWLQDMANGEYDEAVNFEGKAEAGSTDGAYVTRVDLEVKFYGLAFPFLLTKDTHHKIEHFAVKPDDPANAMAETYYHGNHKDNSHFVAYDVVLNLIKKGMLPVAAATVLVPLCKIERRCLPFKDGKGGLVVADLNRELSNYPRLWFYSPKVYKALPEKVAVKLARYKAECVWEHLGAQGQKQLHKVLDKEKYRIHVDEEAVNLKYSLILDKLQRIIMQPRKRTVGDSL